MEGLLSDISTPTLATLKDLFKLIGWILAALAALALASEWITDRELDRRRAAEDAALREQMRKSHQAVAGAQQEAARAREDATRAQNEASSLRQRLEPRSISPDQRTTMIQVLRQSVGSIMVVPPSDPEAQVFAERLGKVLTEAGWTPEIVGGMSFGAVLDFRITVRDLKNPPPRVAVLRRAIEEGLGVQVRMGEQPSEPEDHIRLSVPHRSAELR